MNFALDVRTMHQAWSIMAVTMTVLMISMQRTRKTYPGFGHWTLATLAASLGLILISQRGDLPLAVSMVLGNFLLLMQVALIYRGLGTFLGREAAIWPDAALLLIFLAVYCWFTYAVPDTRARIVLFSIYYVYYYLRCLLVALWQVPELLRSRNWLLIAPMSALTLFYLARVVLTGVWGWGVADVLAPNPMNIATSAATFSLSILVLAGLIFLNVQRLEMELSHAQNELNLLGGLLPICSNCKSIRDDQGYWHAVERYIASHSQTEFTHGICPDCMRKLYPEVAERVLSRLEATALADGPSRAPTAPPSDAGTGS